LFTVFVLVFFSLTAITGPIQKAQAATAPLCGPASGTAGPVTATTVTYSGKKFDIIGYNKGGIEIGVAGPNNSVTLLLDKDEVYTTGQWNSTTTNTYTASTISGAMDTFAISLSPADGIIERTLTGGSNLYSPSPPADYNADYIAGSDVFNQKVWPLSVDEASHLILSTRVLSLSWWTRTPGDLPMRTGLVSSIGQVSPVGGSYVTGSNAFRPALYLALGTAEGLIGAPISNSIPIGACAPQPNNIGIDYIAETITGLDTDTAGWSLADSYAGLTTPTQTTASPINISSNIGATASALYYVKATTNTDLYFNSNSDSNGVARLNAVEGFSKLTIPARPVAPASPEGGVEKITGVTNSMQYSKDEVSWTNVAGTTITGLTSGTYYVRIIADQSESKFKSFATEVVVKAGSAGPSAGPGSRPSAGDGGFSSEGTAQTGVDFTGLELLVLLMLVGIVVLRRPVTGIIQPEIATLRSQ
jgi:hypothetical protein